ncbi:hypothetical protein lerEdw1_006142, partial [Lerista edwardsae]
MLLPVSVTWQISTCLLPPPLLIVNAAHAGLKCSGSLQHTGCRQASCWFSVSLQFPGSESALAGHYSLPKTLNASDMDALITCPTEDVIKKCHLLMPCDGEDGLCHLI